MTTKDEVIDKERRCFIRRATAAVGGVGIVAASVPFISYWMPSADTEAASAPIKIDISTVQAGQQLTVPWRGQPIWFIRRTPEMLDTLPLLNSTLRDPNSDEPQQPSYARNIHRSIKPEMLVAIGICTHLGCVPTYRPDKGSISPAWLGGFYCPCHGSMYDLAGRVYSGVPAPLNLRIPRHMYVSETEIMIGQDSEGEGE